MTPKVSKPIPDARDEATGLARKVLDYSLTFKSVMDKGRRANAKVSPADWAPLAALVSPRFGRQGHLGEEMDWGGYAEMLSLYANSDMWDGRFRRVTETDGLVFLELEEHGTPGDGGPTRIVNTVTVYEFDENGLVKGLDVYLQGRAG